MPRIHRFRRAFIWALCFVAAAAATASDGVWPGLRGPSDGAAGALPEDPALVLDWERELGAGYSSMAVSGGVLVVPFADGDDDVLAGVDAASGKEKWRIRLAEKYEGHDGSDDGPLGTPAVDGDRVFFLGAKGQLVAASMADGKELWRLQLDASNSSVPYYGYTASPLPVDDLVVVLAGGEGRAVTAFDGETGELRWSTGDDSVTYQTPILATLAGRRQIVAVTNFEVYGLDPKTGEALWSLRHTEGNTEQESAHPTVLGDDRLLIQLQNDTLALEIEDVEGRLVPKEAWRIRPFANSLVLPVVHEGKVFGFTGSILTAVDAATGDILWRTRDAKAENLSLVDGHLAVLTTDGHLVLAKAGGEDYAETARLKVFERGDYADPAYADGRFFVRNQKRLAAVRVEARKAAEDGDGPDKSAAEAAGESEADRDGDPR